jgi:hypothetical protein
MLDLAPFFAKFLPSKSLTHLFAAHTAVAKNVFPRIAGTIDSSMVCPMNSFLVDIGRSRTSSNLNPQEMSSLARFTLGMLY